MNKRTFFFNTMLAFMFLAIFEPSYRKTTSEMYVESYTAAMRRQTGMSAAEIRAEEYRFRYEICDEHYNCTNQTADSAKQTEKKELKTDNRPENIKPFIHVPIWQ